MGGSRSRSGRTRLARVKMTMAIDVFPMEGAATVAVSAIERKHDYYSCTVATVGGVSRRVAHHLH